MIAIEPNLLVTILYPVLFMSERYVLGALVYKLCSL